MPDDLVRDAAALPPVEHDEGARQFRLHLDGHTALVQYSRSPQRIVFLHTEVPKALEGRGLGGRLARAALDYAREQKLAVVSPCPFIASYIRRHPEYQDLLTPKERERILGPG